MFARVLPGSPADSLRRLACHLPLQGRAWSFAGGARVEVPHKIWKFWKREGSPRGACSAHDVRHAPRRRPCPCRLRNRLRGGPWRGWRCWHASLPGNAARSQVPRQCEPGGGQVPGRPSRRRVSLPRCHHALSANLARAGVRRAAPVRVAAAPGCERRHGSPPRRHGDCRRPSGCARQVSLRDRRPAR
jgi:hypothetical protein